MKGCTPIIWWKSISYHYVRRSRQVTHYRNGDCYTSSQSYYERVNTCSAGTTFNFTNCGSKDISLTLRGLEKHPATKIRFSKGFSFASDDSEMEFEEQRSRFFQEYDLRDDYMEGREGMDLLNVSFKDYIVSYADVDTLPWYFSQRTFWMASFLLLSWPLRVLIDYKTAYLHYHIHKLFGLNYVDVQSRRNGSDPMFCSCSTRDDTMSSDDQIELTIRNNNFFLPSYADAFLMKPMKKISSLFGMY